MPVQPAKTIQIKSSSSKPAAPAPAKPDAPKGGQAPSTSPNPLQNTGERMKISGIDTNDPNIVALISVVCALIIGAPAIGYVILGYTRKALIYTVGVWAAIFALAIGVFAVSVVTMGFGSLCIFPLILLIFVVDIVIIYDVYCMAKGEKSKLPDI